MSFTFLPVFLVAATAITGIIWLLDARVWRPQRRVRAAAVLDANPEAKDAATDVLREPSYVEISRSFFPVILAVLVIRSFIAEPFRIPSQSMMPTLLQGDFILVNKFSYGLRLPISGTKVLDLGAPARGDVIVFHYPEDPSVDFIKRVVGVGGDHVVYRDKVLSVNGELMAQQPDGAYSGERSSARMNGASQRIENLAGVSHRVLVLPTEFDQPFEFTVPQGQYFVMGDNRDNSRDSRFWGTVPDHNLVGKAFFIWWNIDCGQENVLACLAHAGGNVDWSRIGSSVH
jgi:signal peptidase I